jgi:hypothetical protein
VSSGTRSIEPIPIGKGEAPVSALQATGVPGLADCTLGREIVRGILGAIKRR